MKKKEFIKLIESGDIDDTAEAWEIVYDEIFEAGARHGEELASSDRHFE